MGCDIHNHIEYKRNVYVGDDEKGSPKYQDKWLCGDYYKANPYYREGDKDEEPLCLVGFCDGRNYGLFSILAGVRNYSGNEPISEPRGLPDELSKQVKQDAERWKIDGHSHSFLTLKELLDYQRTQPKLKRSGYVSPQTAKNLDEKGLEPEVWCQWTNQETWVYREWETKDTSVDYLIEEMKKRADELGVIYSFMWTDNPKTAYEKAENIRLVFWFDN